MRIMGKEKVVLRTELGKFGMFPVTKYLTEAHFAVKERAFLPKN